MLQGLRILLNYNKDSSIASLVPGRPIDPDAGSSSSLNRAADWLRNCAEHHANCGPQHKVPLPSRLLDLEALAPPRIRLEETKGTLGCYAALSHCWGSATHFTTSRATIAERRAGIDTLDLPRTFHEAVIVTKRLGIRYLWIDSLCICQDDMEEWARESSNMSSVYSNAFVTIAADAADNNQKGLFVPRARKAFATTTFTTQGGQEVEVLASRSSVTNATFPWKHLELTDNPLTQRAWALQERVLSHRVLHFCREQLCFECNEQFLTEEGFRRQGRYNRVSVTPSSRCHPSPVPLHHCDYKQWHRIIEDYSKRKLTRPSDRLPALSGLANTFGHSLQADYVAGIWSKTLIEGMLWRPQRPSKRSVVLLPQPWLRTYDAPSWSWASYEGEVLFGGYYSSRSYSIATVIDYGIELKSSNPYGEVTYGWIKLRAPLLALKLLDDNRFGEREPSWAVNYFHTNKVCRIRVRRSDLDYALPDPNYFDEARRQLGLFVLIIHQSTDRGHVFYYALIVSFQPDDRSKMCRLGLAFVISGNAIYNESLDKRFSGSEEAFIRDKETFADNNHVSTVILV
ncbi:MAG: hypothetical protein Q9227_000446 [Pyrenula ochraceoflavens]